jgi:SAM-dependent methyltransferase
VWRSIAFPVELEDVQDPTRVTEADVPPEDEVYFAETESSSGSRAMRKFHRKYVIGRVALPAAKALVSDRAAPRMLDLACGRAGDINNWEAAGLREVLGVDHNEAAVLEGYRRLAELRRKRASAVGTVVLLQADLSAAGPLADKAAAANNESLRRLSLAVFGREPNPALGPVNGMGARQFDIVSCMFALHYFFRDADTLGNFVDVLDEALRPGGVFVGTDIDGAAVDREFAARGETDESNRRFAIGRAPAASPAAAPGAAGRQQQRPAAAQAPADGGGAQEVVWRLTRDYGDREFAAAGEPGANLGMRILAYVDNINKETPEFLLDFDELVRRLRERGIRLLNRDELRVAGLQSSAGMFSEVFEATDWAEVARSRSARSADAADAAVIAGMTEDEKRYSFMHRYFLFRKDAAGA